MEELNKLKGNFDKILSSLIESVDDDLTEAEANASVLFELIDGDTDSRMIYGGMYHDALKIKGQVRERTLKIANLLKERIAKVETDQLKIKKESDEETDDLIIDHRSIGQSIKDLKKQGEIQYEKLEEINHNVEDTEYNETLDFVPKKNK